MIALKPTAYFLLFLLISTCSKDEIATLNSTEPDSVYYPPISTTTWETTSLNDLNWNTNALQPLLDFLEDKNSKGFIVLHNGKIVVEQYFNSHNENANWYWASAGKTLTTAVSGIAQDEGLININNKVSTYLGTGWTSASLEKENLITCKNLLSMNSGLDDSLGDVLAPENLQYITDAGERWAYHNVYLSLIHI